MKTVYKVLLKEFDGKLYSIAIMFIKVPKKYEMQFVRTQYHTDKPTTASNDRYPYLFVFDNPQSALYFARSYIPLRNQDIQIWECSASNIASRLPWYVNPRSWFPQSTRLCKKLTLNKLLWSYNETR